LEGFDENWFETDGTANFATFTNLNHGNYILHLQGSNADGTWNKEGISLKIKVLPPFLKTWYAMLIYIFILVLALLALRYMIVFREHMKVELKKLQVKVGTTFVYITHDQSEAMVMSDYVAVMNAGHFEQVGTPQNLYSNPSSAFVAQFVGKNNKFIAKQAKDENGNFFAETKEGHSLKLSRPVDLKDDNSIELYVRPEAMIINPKGTKENFNILDVTVEALLFDGGNSRLLVVPKNSKQELIVSLPQNRQFDYIKAKDKIKIGWDPEAAVCFNKTDGKIYEEL